MSDLPRRPDRTIDVLAVLRESTQVLSGRELLDDVSADLLTAAATQRVWWAIQLARDLETCRSLLRGEPVDGASLDRVVLGRAQERAAVVLLPTIELFEVPA